MTDGLIRRQSRQRVTRQRQDIEAGFHEEDDSDDDSHSGEAYSNSACGKAVTSCIQNPALRGSVLSWERRCCSAIWYSKERIRKHTLWASTSTVLSRFYSVCRRYFETPEDRTIASSSAINGTEDDASEPYQISSRALDDNNDPFGSPSDTKYPSPLPELSVVPEDTIMSSPVRIDSMGPIAETYNFSVPDSPLTLTETVAENSSFSTPENRISPEMEKYNVSVPDSSLTITETIEDSFHTPESRLSPEMDNAEDKASVKLRESSPMDESTKPPKLLDYSKFSAQLAYSSLNFLAVDITKESEYIKDLNDTDEEESERAADAYEFDVIESDEDAKIHFYLRAPTKSKFRNPNRTEEAKYSWTRTLQRKLSSGRLTGETSNSSSGKMRNGERTSESIGSNASDATPSQGCVAPSRRSFSEDSDESFALGTSSSHSMDHTEKFYTPKASPSQFERKALSSVGSPNEERRPKGRKARRCSFVAGSKIERYDGNFPRKNRYSGSSEGSLDISEHRTPPMPPYDNYRPGSSSYRRGSSDDDDHFSRSSKKDHRREKAKRRSSFVAGSKIERFDGPVGRTKRRPSISSFGSSKYD